MSSGAFNELVDTSSVQKLIDLLGEIPQAAKRADESIKDLGDSTGRVAPRGRRRTASGRDADEDVFPLSGSPYGTFNSSISSYDGRRKEERDENFVGRWRSSGTRGQERMGTSDEDLLKGFSSAFNQDLASAKAQWKFDNFIPKTPKTQQELLMDAIMTSRVLPGGVLSPLVGKLAKAGVGLDAIAGSGAVSGGTSAAIAAAAAAAIPVALAAAGLGGVVAIAEAGASHVRTGTNAFWASGGTPSELGQIIGLGGPNAGSKAEALGGALRGGGYGAAWARSQGIVDLGDYFTPDKATNYLKTLRALRNVQDPTERMRIVRGLGIQEDAWTSDLSKQSFENLAQTRSAYSEQDRRNEAEYRGAKEQLGGEWDNIVRKVGAPVMNLLLKAKDLNDLFSPAGMAHRLYNDIADLVTGHDPKADKASSDSSSPASGRTNYRYRMARYETIGGTSRTESAVPPGVVGNIVNGRLVDDNIRLGGLAV